MDKNKICQALIDANVVKFGDFTLASGKKSPIYVDLRVLPSFPDDFAIALDALSEKARNFDVIAGAETAGIPLAAGIALKLRKPMVYVRKKEKEHGTKSKVEGKLEKGQSVILIDDLITDGGSKVGFVEGVRANGARINDILVILDREQGGTETLKEVDIKLHSLITLKELLEYMKSKKLIKEEKYKEVLDYLKIKPK